VGILIGIACFVGGWLSNWLSQGIRERLSIFLMNYKLSHSLPIDDLTIYFSLPRWKRLLSILIPPNREKLRAEVRYKYEGQELWTFPVNAVWEDTGGTWTIVDDVGVRRIQILRLSNNGQMLPLNEDKPLPSRYTLNIRLIRQAGEKIIANFTIPIVIESGHLTKEGFLPDKEAK